MENVTTKNKAMFIKLALVVTESKERAFKKTTPITVLFRIPVKQNIYFIHLPIHPQNFCCGILDT